VTYQTHKVWACVLKEGRSGMTREESIELLDPELIAYLERPFDDLNALPLPIARAQADAALRALGGPVKTPPQVVTIKGLDGDPDLEVRVHHPLDGPAKRGILHIHGGGMVKGSAAALDGRMSGLAEMLGAVIASVEYRLAPETPFPGPLHDCVAAWLWLVEQAPTWGLDADKCIISGDSSGGGLAAATCFYLRDMGGVMPAGQVLVYPMLDYQTGIGQTGNEPEAVPDQRLGWNSSNNQFGWLALLGQQPLPIGDRLGHYSPSHALTFEGLPPTWIGVGSIDLFLEEDVAFARAIALAGGDVTLCTYKGTPHGFQSIPSRVSTRFYRDYVAAFSSMVP
jgi:acetyl esterase